MLRPVATSLGYCTDLDMASLGILNDIRPMLFVSTFLTSSFCNSHIALLALHLVVGIESSSAGHDSHTLDPSQEPANRIVIVSGADQHTGTAPVGKGYLHYAEGYGGAHAEAPRHMLTEKERETTS